MSLGETRGTLLVAPHKTLRDAKRREAEQRAIKRIRQSIEADSVREIQFLEFVAQNPWIPSGQTYLKLRMALSTGNITRDTLIEKGLMEVRTGSPRNGEPRGKLLHVTPEGEKALKEQKAKKLLSESR